jgi:hypothetical protein
MWVNESSVIGRSPQYYESVVKRISMSKTENKTQQRRIRILVAKPGLE